MLFVATYTFRGDLSQESAKEMLAVVASRPPSQTEIAHYIAADGSGGVVISDFDADSLSEVYEGVLHMQPWLEMHVKPVMKVEDAMPTIMNVYG